MFGLREYAIAPRGGCWPPGECLVLDPAGGPVAVVREEPWPEVLTRAWPEGSMGRPWLWWLLGVDRHPRQKRTVVRRLCDGLPVARLHHRQPLFGHTVGIFDHEDRQVGYCVWSIKGSGWGDHFDINPIPDGRRAEVRRTEAGDYRVAERTSGLGWGAVTVSQAGVPPGPWASCRVSLAEAAFGHEQVEISLLSAALMLIRPGPETVR